MSTAKHRVARATKRSGFLLVLAGILGFTLAMSPAPTVGADTAAAAETDVVYQVTWEHLAFQFGANNRNNDSMNEYLPFRQAVAHAIDKELLAATLGTTPIDSYVTAYDPALSQDAWAHYNYNPALAETLLAQLCGDLGRDCTLNPPTAVFTANADRPDRVELSELLCQMLGDVGIQCLVELDPDVTVYLGDTLHFGTFDLAEWAWSSVVGDFEGLVGIHSIFDPDATIGGSGELIDGLNYYRWGTPDSLVINAHTVRMGELVDLMNATTDEAELVEYIHEAEQIAADQLVMIPIGLRSTIINVPIDIQPGEYPNTLNINGHGAIPVAILGSESFDVTHIDTATLDFAGLEVRANKKGKVQCSFDDVSGDFTFPNGAPDGYLDLTCHFRDDLDRWDPDNGTATLTGSLLPEHGATPFSGSDSFRLVPIGNFAGVSIEAESCDYGGLLKRITAIDRLTVEFELCRPQVALPSIVAFPAFGIHSQEYLEATGGTGDLITSPIGTGPYEFESWSNEISLIPYDGYWGDPAGTPLTLQWETDPAVRFAHLTTGTADGIERPDPSDYGVIETNPDLTLLVRDPLNIFYIGMNRDFAPFDDMRVRQAMAMAVDRQRIVDLFFPEQSLVADQFLPPAMFGYTEQPGWYEHDPGAAASLLTEAGYPEGFDVTLNYRDVERRYLPAPELVAAEIAAQLSAIDIDVTIEVMDSGPFVEATQAGEVPFYLLGWTVDWPDPTNMLDFHFGPGSLQFGAGFPDLWDVLTAAHSTADAAGRLALYQEAAQLIKLHVPMIPVAHAADAMAFQADVTGAYASPMGVERFAVMNPAGRAELVFTDVAEPSGLYCGDESDGPSLGACAQINDPLLTYEVGGTGVEAALATDWSASSDLTLWTFALRDKVEFHDGTSFDANDVVTTYAMMWDAAHPLHVGSTGRFEYFAYVFGLLNQD